MRSMRKVTGLVAVVTVGAVGLAMAAPSQAASPPVVHSGVVNATPGLSPNVLDASVTALTQVGSTVIIGGGFSSVSNPGSSTIVRQPFLAAYDTNTGLLVPNWSPVLDGPVTSLVPDGQGNVYVGGRFRSVNHIGGKVALLKVADGTSVAGFSAAPLNGAVSDMALIPADPDVPGDLGRLFVGGSFTTASAQARGGLAALVPGTGLLVPNYTMPFLTGHHNFDVVPGASQGSTGAENVALNPAGNRLIVDGNFRTVTDGAGPAARDQIVSINISPTGATVDRNWNTSVYTPTCNKKFDSYVRDVAWSPDGSFFVVGTTGGYTGTPPSGTWCDSVNRFDASSAGTAVMPRWTDRTGGDSIYSVAVTSAAVYAGGHQRWMNNDHGQDRPGPGAVPRPGLAALDPRTGVPLAWNPGRNPRGNGAELIYPTADGLWVGSDTDWIGNFHYKKPKLAFFPLEGGAPVPSDDLGNPTKIYIGGSSGNSFTARAFSPTTGTAGAPTAQTSGAAIPWSSVRGAFLLNGRLWFGLSNGTFAVRSFDGTTFGPALNVDPYRDPAWAAVASGSKTPAGDPIPYGGTKSELYGVMSSVTAMFYSNGAIYYTRTGNARLLRRSFSPDPIPSTAPNSVLGGVIGATEQVVATTGFTGVGGMFLADGKLYFAGSDGKLRSVAFLNGAASGPSVPVTAAGSGWRGKAVFTSPN
jgi:hypothetical protein